MTFVLVCISVVGAAAYSLCDFESEIANTGAKISIIAVCCICMLHVLWSSGLSMYAIHISSIIVCSLASMIMGIIAGSVGNDPVKQ